MQTHPDHLNPCRVDPPACQPLQRVQASNAKQWKRQGHGIASQPRWLNCFTMQPARLLHVSLCINKDIPEGSNVMFVLRHDRQALHEANNLISPPTHPWLISQLSEDECWGDTLQDEAILACVAFVWSGHTLTGPLLKATVQNSKVSVASRPHQLEPFERAHGGAASASICP